MCLLPQCWQDSSSKENKGLGGEIEYQGRLTSQLLGQRRKAETQAAEMTSERTPGYRITAAGH